MGISFTFTPPLVFISIQCFLSWHF